MKRFTTMLLATTLLGACGGSPAPEPETGTPEPGVDGGSDTPALDAADEGSPSTAPATGSPDPGEPAASEPVAEAGFADRDGAIEARRDIDRGTFTLKTFGKPALARSEYARLLDRELGVKLDAVAGCVVTEELITFVRTYNEVMEAHLKIKHGDDVLEKLWQRAEKLVNNR